MAEVHGRNRRGDDLEPLGARIDRGSALPLSVERSPAEQRIQAEFVIAKLALGLNVDFPAAQLVRVRRDQGMRASDRLTALAIQLAGARDKGDLARASVLWRSLAELLYRWDARIQDELAAGPFGTASAYQLGRGLAEAYWALDALAPDQSMLSWSTVLGTARCSALISIIERLAGYLPDGTAEALVSSLTAWRNVAQSASWRETDPSQLMLRHQVDTWRDLLLSESDPRKVLATSERLKEARRSWRFLLSFAPELAVGALALGAIGVAVFLISSGNHVVGAVFTALATLGITSAGVVARLKATAGDIIDQLKRALLIDMVKARATFVPGEPRVAFLPDRGANSRTIGTTLLLEEVKDARAVQSQRDKYADAVMAALRSGLPKTVRIQEDAYLADYRVDAMITLSHDKCLAVEVFFNPGFTSGQFGRAMERAIETGNPPDGVLVVTTAPLTERGPTNLREAFGRRLPLELVTWRDNDGSEAIHAALTRLSGTAGASSSV
jgi:hypothetical protein